MDAAKSTLIIANGGGVKSIKHLPNLKYPFWFAPQMTNYVNIGISGQSPEQIREIAKAMPDPLYYLSSKNIQGKFWKCLTLVLRKSNLRYFQIQG